MTDEEIDAMLADLAQQREATAILVDGKRRIRRDAFVDQGRNTAGDRLLTAFVWDDEYATTLIFVDGRPRPELVRGLFLDRKRQAQAQQ